MKSSCTWNITLLSFVSIIICIITTASCATCNKPLPEGIQPGKSVDLKLSSKSGVTPRKYRLHVPPSYKEGVEYPLILSFHGRGKNAKSQEKLSQFSNSSYGFDGIVAYPEGVPNATGVQQFQGDPNSPSQINDVKFTLELLDHLTSTFCIDTTRIYAAGKSNGGGFTGLLACDPEASKRIAAFALVSPALYLDNATGKLPACKPSRMPIPIMHFHGFVDGTIRYSGGLNTRKNGTTTSIIKYVHDWVRRDGFDVASAGDGNLLCGNGKKKVTRYRWGGETVVHYNYTNGQHDWPSSFFNGDTGENEKRLTCKDAEATGIILEWFKKWTLL